MSALSQAILRAEETELAKTLYTKAEVDALLAALEARIEALETP